MKPNGRVYVTGGNLILPQLDPLPYSLYEQVNEFIDGARLEYTLC